MHSFNHIVFVALVASLSYTQATAQNRTLRIGDFGDDSGQYANDGDCDDPRFVGDRGTLAADNQTGQDATDCRDLFNAGRIQWGTAPDEGAPTTVEDGGLLVGDFGDDSGQYANDGDCDDPRFTGDRGAAAADTETKQDATDCRKLLNAGRLRWRTSAVGDLPATAPQAQGEWVFCELMVYRGQNAQVLYLTPLFYGDEEGFLRDTGNLYPEAFAADLKERGLIARVPAGALSRDGRIWLSICWDQYESKTEMVRFLEERVQTNRDQNIRVVFSPWKPD